MNLRFLLLALIFITFAGYSIWVMSDIGYLGIWQAGFASWGALQILLDLVIVCLIFSSWMLADAKARNINPVPWLLAIVTTGSLAILLYLLLRESSKTSTAV